MPLPIENYALIGDLHTGCLVGTDGSIDWSCLPRFDSPACFAALLGTAENGRWLLAPADPVTATSRRYVDGTALLETTFTTADGEVVLAVPAAELFTSDPAVATVRPVAAAAPVSKAVPASKPVVAVAKPVDDGLVIKRVLDVPKPFRHGDYVWNDEGVPDGPLVITADIAAQTISVFRGGYEIGAAVILYGADDMPTPTGVFPITQKSKDHVSNLYGVPMPYMMRLTNDGVAIHASDVDLDSATRGCIGVPKPFAKLLFAAAKLGDKVIVTNGERLNVGGRIDTI